MFGISRKTFFEWRSLAERYGVEALVPKQRRGPQLPNATPTWVMNELLTLAVTEPTIGCRPYADRLGDGATASPSPPCRRSSSPTVWAGGPSGCPGPRPWRQPRPG